MKIIYLLMGLEILGVMLVGGYLIRKLYRIFLERKDRERNSRT